MHGQGVLPPRPLSGEVGKSCRFLVKSSWVNVTRSPPPGPLPCPRVEEAVPGLSASQIFVPRGTVRWATNQARRTLRYRQYVGDRPRGPT